jgi:hypothetical protein
MVFDNYMKKLEIFWGTIANRGNCVVFQQRIAALVGRGV